MESLNPKKLTWAALLGHWIEFARSAVALPDNAEGQAWRRSIPDIIGLQALCMALNDMDDLAADERALGLDRARILAKKHVLALTQAFGNAQLHPMLRELIDDTYKTIHRAESMSREI